MREAVARHAADDLVLSGHVQFIQNFIQFLLHLEHLRLKLFDSCVLLLIQEAEVLCFVLRLAKRGLPAELHLIEGLLALNNLQVQLIVLLDQSLVLMLQGQLSLRIKSGLLGEYRVLVLDGLECLCSFQKLVQQSLNEST